MKGEREREREVQDNRAVTMEQRRRLGGDDLFPPACYPLSQLGLCSMNNIWRRASALFCVLRNRATSTHACTTRATRCTHARTHAPQQTGCCARPSCAVYAISRYVSRGYRAARIRPAPNFVEFKRLERSGGGHIENRPLTSSPNSRGDFVSKVPRTEARSKFDCRRES